LKQLPPLPDVPITLVTGARPGDDPLRIKVLPVWTKSHADFVSKLPQGRHVIEPGSGHGVHVEAPALVIDLIHDAVKQSRGRSKNTKALERASP
jgi:pimeloyl-ACP methyl ester carboxylesterase